MKVTISIDCEDERELLTHLSVIRQQVKKEFKKLDKEPEQDVVRFSDSNCYGNHNVEMAFND